MGHELKIIVGETNANTIVLLNNQQLGLIQDIKVNVSVDSPSPEVEITFPNIFSFADTNKELVELLKNQLDLLKSVPNVKVNLKALDFNK